MLRRRFVSLALCLAAAGALATSPAEEGARASDQRTLGGGTGIESVGVRVTALDGLFPEEGESPRVYLRADATIRSLSGDVSGTMAVYAVAEDGSEEELDRTEFVADEEGFAHPYAHVDLDIVGCAAECSQDLRIELDYGGAMDVSGMLQVDVFADVQGPNAPYLLDSEDLLLEFVPAG